MEQWEQTRDSISRATIAKRDKNNCWSLHVRHKYNNSDRESKFMCVFVSGVAFRSTALD